MNTASEICLRYLLVKIKRSSHLAKNLAFCQLDIWDFVLLVNCPSEEIFEEILKNKMVLANAVNKQLPSIKLISMRSEQGVIELPVKYLIGQRPRKYPRAPQLIFGLDELVKQSKYPVFVLEFNGQILSTPSLKTQDYFPLKSISLNSSEANRLVEAIKSHGWVSGFRLQFDSNLDSKGIIATVRARVADSTQLKNLVLVTQILSIDSTETLTLKNTN